MSRMREQLEVIAEQIQNYRVRFGTERLLQDDVARVLWAHDVRFLREHRLDAESRIDFYLPDVRIGIECKVDGAPTEVTRQLLRYAAFPTIDGLMLVSRRKTHGVTASELAGKPFCSLWVGGSSL